MNREEEIYNWRARFAKFGIHELLALKDILEGLDKQNEAWYWEAQDCLLQKKRAQDQNFNTIMVALEVEIEDNEEKLEKEYKAS